MARTGYHHASSPDALTGRQRLVLERIAAGRTNGEIASELGVTIDGVKWHVREIFDRLDVSSREEAAEWWRRERSVGRRLIAVPMSLGFGGPVAVAAAVGIAILVAVVTIGVVVALRSPAPAEAPPSSVEPALPTEEAPATPSPEVTPAATPTTAAPTPPVARPLHPDSTRTGVAAIDNFLNERELGGAEAIASLIEYSDFACTTQPAIGSVECREGEADGTQVPVVRVNGGCEPVFARPDEVPATIEGRVLSPAYQLYAIVSAEGSVFLIYENVTIDYDHAMSVAIRLDSGNIWAIGNSCAESPADFFSIFVDEGADIILPPAY
jgi:DNA-binding CsgD family transcriptional regulator